MLSSGDFLSDILEIICERDSVYFEIYLPRA